ncbi:XGD1, partial [Symbiodinium microadriaticum]
FLTRAMTDRKFSTFAQFRAVVLWPYDMDLITFYEFYGMNMPIFMPSQLSKYLFHQDHQSYNYRWGERDDPGDYSIWATEEWSPFQEQRCCVQGDPACWDELYTREKCCGGEFGNETRVVRGTVEGDPACWIDGYSYEECCLEDPKEGCWDDNFIPERCCVDKVEDLGLEFCYVDGELQLRQFVDTVHERGTFELVAWTIHLYESFFFGCIPVLLSDEVSVPFQDEIDWPRLSFKVPSSIDMAELHTRLRSVRFGQLKSMYRELAAARCWFDYSRGWGAEGRSEEGCSPYLGLIRGLARRAEALQRGLYQLPLYWAPPELET